MPRSEESKKNKRKYDASYAKTHYKRVPLDVPFALYDQVKEAAAAAGDSVAGYIKGAIISRLDSENK